MLTHTVTHAPIGKSRVISLLHVRDVGGKKNPHGQRTQAEKDRELNQSCCECHCGAVLLPFLQLLRIKMGGCNKNNTA